MVEKQLIITVEGTAAMGPYWRTIVSDYLEKIIMSVPPKHLFSYCRCSKLCHDEEGHNVNYKRDSKGRNGRKRRVVLNSSDEDIEDENAMSLASPGFQQEQLAPDSTCNAENLTGKGCVNLEEQKSIKLEIKTLKEAGTPPFNTPDLRVGTLDSLLSLSDDLVKSNSFIEGISHKIRRQIEELERVSGVDGGALTVDGIPVDSFLTRFVWDESRYPMMSPLKEIVDCIHSQVVKIEDDLKVPRSSKKLHEDNEYALYTVSLFGRVADNFKTSARERGFQLPHVIQIRDFECSPEAQQSRQQELVKLVQDQENMKSSLLQWCYTSYGEVFSSWMHFCAVRVFAESILRYGLPPSFLSVVLAHPVKSEKKVRSILEQMCGTTNSIFWKSTDEVNVPGIGGEAEAYPYVSFTINII
ncbi:V-type proton ATPase subunit C [Acorus calamus]|uniref:V-type proton ATPase subunit C n=1 Tax=Acorus calamus TaxID=4465 RepID=A0AAV9E9U1_ACOCL|nr:V-type proton ATPase subunit C [Acorus calamus]